MHEKSIRFFVVVFVWFANESVEFDKTIMFVYRCIIGNSHTKTTLETHNFATKSAKNTCIVIYLKTLIYNEHLSNALVVVPTKCFSGWSGTGYMQREQRIEFYGIIC